MRFMVLLGLALLLTGTAADAGDLRGIVTDERGLPLPGAHVRVTGPSVEYRNISDGAGLFEFRRLPVGTYQLTVSYVGYEEYQTSISAPADGANRVEIQLQPLVLTQPEVVVRAERAEVGVTPITFTNLTARDIEEAPDMKDVPAILSQLPSVTWHSENGNGIGYSTLRMRGIDQRRIAVLINGIPENDPEDQDVYWINFFDLLGSVRDVQVQRGAGSAYYGSAGIGGAINIVADPYQADPYAMLQAGAGSYGTRRLTMEANSGLRNGLIAHGSFSRLLSDGYREWAWSRFYRFFAGVKKVGNRSALTIQAYGGPQEDGLAYGGVEKSANTDREARRSNYSSFTQDVEHFFQPHLEVLHDLAISPGLDLHQALFATKAEGYFDFGGTFRSANYLHLPAGFRNLTAEERKLPLYITAPDAAVLFRAYMDQWQVGWLPRLTWVNDLGTTRLGAEARLHRSLRWGRIQEGAGLGEQPVPGSRVYQFHGEKVTTGATASHYARPLDRLAVQADVQVSYLHYRHYDEATFQRQFRVPYLFVNPRLGLTINPERPVRGYLSVALAGREPRLKALYDGEEAGEGFLPRFEQHSDGSYDFTRPFVKPEYLVDVEGGVAIEQPSWRISATGFLMAFRDEIVPSGSVDQYGIPRTGNAERSRHLGVELESVVALSRAFSVEANATLARNRFIRYREYLYGEAVPVVRDGNPIAGAPERIVNGALKYRIAGLTAALTASHVGPQYVDNGGGKTPAGVKDENLVVDPYLLAGLSATYAFPAHSPLDGLSISADVNNLLDQEILLYGNMGAVGPQFFPAATRHFFIGVSYTIR